MTAGDNLAAPIIVVMGVSGSGKTTIGQLLAERLDLAFAEGDAFHPPANVAKMAAGNPLNDQDRGPWLKTMADLLGTWHANGSGGVLACSALKRAYRQILAAGGGDVWFVYLQGSMPEIRARLDSRTGHYMPASLLESQFQTLEEPAADENVLAVSIEGTAAEIVTAIVDRLAVKSTGQR